MEFALIVLAIAIFGAGALIAFAILRGRTDAQSSKDSRSEAMIAAQSAIAAQFQQAVSAANGQLSQRIDALNQHVGETLKESAEKTATSLGSIGQRLNAIDQAQKNITELSGQVVSLQEILANKQSRGAFGQAQMEEIVRDGLPASLYEFQPTLSNNCRPDCKILLPGASTSIIIDSKFPLEAFQMLREAKSDEQRKLAQARIRADVARHVSDIAEKYLIPGETQSPAIMFVPSESIYAELFDGFSDVIDKARRSDIIVVSPNILMLAINTIQTVMKGARMREQATLIQREVGLLLQDVQRLAEQAEALKRHYGQGEKDLKDIGNTVEKITRRGAAITNVEVSDGERPKLAIVKETS